MGFSASAVGAQEAPRYPVDPLAIERPRISATRVASSITIDGVLSDAAWSEAFLYDAPWIQTIPDPGMPASQPTELRIVYDDEALYIGAVLYDEDPASLAVPGLEQDFDTPNADIFGVALDTYLDRQNGFLFAINAAGAVWDAQAFNDQRDIVPAWEGIVDVRTSISDVAWIVEMRIPFATLRFNPVEGDQLWGVNFSRRIRRRNEDALWAPVSRQYRVYKFSLAGTMDGLSDLPRSRNLWLKPFALGDAVTGSSVPEDGRTNGSVGLDVKWGITSRMTLDLTANTDFSQVEVDREQVNLTRFSLFFPEKRDFFLENEGTFGFQDIAIRNYRTGSSPRNFRLFHSRRIGLSSTREALPIGGGARLTGRIGDRLEVGFLDMQTRSEGLSDGSFYNAENFAVGRVKAHLGAATVGGIVVNRQQTGGIGDAYNRAYGFDANVQATQNLLLSAYWARTDDDTPVGDDRAIVMGQAAYRNPFWNVSGLFKQVGDGFAPETGFIDRTSVRRFFGTIGVHPQLARGGIREIAPYVDVDAYTTLAGDLETRRVEGGFVVEPLQGGRATFALADRWERLFTDTPIAGASVPAGTYSWLQPSVSLTTPGNYPFFVSANVAWGSFYDGSRRSISGDITFRPNEHLSVEVGAQHNALSLGGSDFTADLFSARLRYAWSTRSFFLAFVQYSEATDELIANARFNLIHAPLSDVFLVFTERRTLADGAPESVLERGVTLKVTRLLAF